MPNELQDLSVREVSLVDAPANSSTDKRTGIRNPHARVALWKRDSGDTLADLVMKELYPPLGNSTSDPRATSYADVLAGIREMKDFKSLGDSFSDSVSALSQSVWSIIADKSVTDKKAAIKKEVDAFAASVSDITKAVDGKTQGGARFPKADFAYTPSNEPSTWKLRLTKTPGGKPDAGIVGAAAAALGKGFRGNRAQIPDEDRPAVVARVRAAWKQANPDKGGAELPDVLKGDETKMPMTLEQLEKKFTEVETTVTKLTTENDLLKRENELVTKMSKKERKAYAFMGEDKKKEYMAGDAEKRKSMIDDTTGKMKEKAAEDCMDAATKAEFAKAGPTVRADMIAKAVAEMEKKKAKSKGGKDGAATDDNGKDNDGDDDEDNEDEETVKRLAALEKRNGDLTDRVVKSDALLSELQKKDRLQHFTDIAKRELPNGSGTDVVKAGEIMELAEKCGGEDSALYKSLFTRLVEADKALKPMFGEVGKSGAGGQFQPEKQLESIAKSIQGRDKVTYEKAFGTAMEENPQLYAEYEQMQRDYARR